MINPGSEVYKSHYLADIGYFTFSSQLSVQARMEIEYNTIETDVSLMPYSDVVTENVIHISSDFSRTFFIPTPTAPNAEIIFKKSSNNVTYKREFNKVDAYLSYVGGLAGIILGLIIIMGPFTEKAYEISLARKILVDNKSKEIESKSFNLGYLFLMYIKPFLDFINVNPKWTKVQKFIDCSE